MAESDFQKRLEAMKGKQEAGDKKKQEEETKKAEEAARLEREGKRSELAGERDRIAAELPPAEKAATEAQVAIAQADAFAAEQGDNLDPEAKAEIDALKAEAGEAEQKFDTLKTQLETITAQIASLESSTDAQTEISDEAGEKSTPIGSTEQPSRVSVQESAKIETGEQPGQNQTTEAKPESVGKAENSVDKLKLELGKVLEKVKTARVQLEELKKQQNALAKEKDGISKTGDAGNKDKLDELDKKIEVNLAAQGKIELGEKRFQLENKFQKQDHELFIQQRKLEEERSALWKQEEKRSLDSQGRLRIGVSFPSETYRNDVSPIAEKQKTTDLAREDAKSKFQAEWKALSASENWEENGLDGLQKKQRELMLELKNQEDDKNKSS